ncbi:hypothetical protein METSCH_D05070 [Metschnikowia aff. pulcherrima]|uniref:Uncharacterized protein n=1 Tax=Metschnikowia aff. pulcherrima TaxID=2163413 RepID=A0A4P6XRQ1_9ASCO|nr:hypothetical protein METSCH_D05070 [Metschnikowia aff. pulcherrima]
MLSSQQSYKQAILEAAQTSDKVPILTKIYYWLYPDKYAKSLFGNNCDQKVLQKLNSQSSTRIMKVVFFSSIIFSLALGFGFSIGAMVSVGTRQFYPFALYSICIFLALADRARNFLLEFEDGDDPLDIEADLSSFTRTRRIWSRRLWCFAIWPINAALLALLYDVAVGKPINIVDFINSLKLTPV